MNDPQVTRNRFSSARAAKMNKHTFIAVCLLILAGAAACRKKAAPAEIERAKKVIRRYNRAWLAGDSAVMFKLSTRERIRKLTGIDLSKNTDGRKRAMERFELVTRQALTFMGYKGFEIVETVSAKPKEIVFRIKALHRKKGRERASFFARQVVKVKGKWLLN
jgi:hypothetical protein